MEAWMTITLPIFAVFGALGWISVFLETYRHFPKMDAEQRMALSIGNATVLTAFLFVVVYAFMHYYFDFIVNP